MDRSLECYRKSVRETMMKQEQIFQQQVCALHSLYKVQKRLMAEVGIKEAKLDSFKYRTPEEVEDTKNRFWGSGSTSETSHSSYTSIRYYSAGQLSSENKNAGPSSRELSICSDDPSRKPKGFYLNGKTITEGPELYSEGENGIDLELSIGHGVDKNKSKNRLPSSRDSKELGDPSKRLDGESLQEPSWLFQSLNLNRT